MKNLVAVFVFLTTPFLAGCGDQAFHFQVAFHEAPGLVKGSEVRYLGLLVGNVENISLQQLSEGAPPAVVAGVAIKNKALRVRRDDRFTISSAGLLGEMYVEIKPGPTTSPLLPPGATVDGKGPLQISLDGLSNLIGHADILPKLNSLPSEKREELLKSFRKLVDDAVREQSNAKSSEAKTPIKK